MTLPHDGFHHPQSGEHTSISAWHPIKFVVYTGLKHMYSYYDSVGFPRICAASAFPHPKKEAQNWIVGNVANGLLFTDDRFLWPLIWMILKLSIPLSTILCIMKSRAPWLVTFRLVMPAAAYIFFMIVPSLWVQDTPLKKEAKENESKWKGFWIINTKMSSNKEDSCILNSQNIALFF